MLITLGNFLLGHNAILPTGSFAGHIPAFLSMIFKEVFFRLCYPAGFTDKGHGTTFAEVEGFAAYGGRETI